MKTIIFMNRSTIILSLMLWSQVLVGQAISWSEQTSLVVLPEGVRLFKGVRSSPILEAWYLDVDLNQPDLMIRSYLASSSDIVPDLTESFGAYAAVNGGYFGGSNSYSAVIYPNEVKAQNVAAVTRNGQAYPVMRSLFSLDDNRQPRVDWIYHYGNLVENVYAFDAPLAYSYNQSTPLPSPSQDGGNVLENLLVGIGGGPTLVKNSAVNVTYDEEVMWGSGVGYENGDPRTAVGYTADGHAILMVVDGRQSISQGLGLPELASTLVGLGCVEAMNLDGGGSTGMAIGGDYVNHPSEQRSVPSILAIVHADSVQFPETPANEIIIDTGDMGCELDGGGWFPTANLGYWGATPSLLNAVGTGDRTATFSFTLEQDVSEADVYAWWVAAPNRATSVPILVQHALGEDTVYVDQTSNHGQWNQLGTYSFTSDQVQAVIVSNAASGGQYVVADAVRITSATNLETVSLDEKEQKTTNMDKNLNVYAFPNPFNPEITIRFQLPYASMVQVRVYDLSGRLVKDLSQNGLISPGSHALSWNGVDLENRHIESGIYIAQIETDNHSESVRLVNLK